MAQIIDLAYIRRKKGATAQQLADKLGKSARTVRRYTAIPREIYLAQVDAQRTEAQKLAKEGMTQTEIAKALKVHRTTIYRWLKASQDQTPKPADI